MFRAIGLVIVIYALSQLMSGAFTAFEQAIIATFEAVEMAASVSKSNLAN